MSPINTSSSLNSGSSKAGNPPGLSCSGVTILLVGDLYLLSDKHQWIISRAEKKRWRHVGFYRHLDNALTAALEHHLRGSASKTTEELRNELRTSRATICQAIRSVKSER